MYLSNITTDDDSLRPLVAEIDRYEHLVAELTEQTMQLSTKIANVVKELSDIGAQLSVLGRKSGHQSVDKAGGLIRIGAALWGKYKQHKIEQRKTQMEQQLEQMRAQIASQKLGFAVSQRAKFAKTLDLFAALHSQNSTREINLSESPTAISGAIGLCKTSFLLYAKAKYLDHLLAFVISQMQTWSRDNKPTTCSKPSISAVVKCLISTWGTDSNIKRQVALCITNLQAQQMPVWVLFICSEPYLLMNCAGVCLPGEALDCSDNTAVIKSIDDQISRDYMGEQLSVQTLNPIVESILANNDYYKLCKKRTEEYADTTLNYNFGDIVLFVLLWIISSVCTYFSFAAIRTTYQTQWYLIICLTIIVLILCSTLCFKLLSPLRRYRNHMERCMHNDIEQQKKMNKKFNTI